MEQPAGSKMSDFERWEKRYGAPGDLFGTAPNAFLAAQPTGWAGAEPPFRLRTLP
jgi:hypothetical protein